jgi:uracil-DNA glycosylase family protein
VTPPRAARAPTASIGPTASTVRPASFAAAAEAGRVGLSAVAGAAVDCRACGLWANATQTVFGRGPGPARLMLVGEQPGDREDRAGEPFVGPAGRILDEALAAAGLDRERAFVTNVVKHFKWRPVPGQKRRLHERPNRAEVGACLPWVAAELALVRPEVLVLLGATAAQALLGPAVRITRDHGRPLESRLAPLVLATIHPSAVLRASGPARGDALDGLVRDLELAAGALARATTIAS